MRAAWLVILGAAAVGIVLAADPPTARQKDLVVHEWGVLSVHNDVELANADMRAVWEGLPRFIYGRVDQRRIPQEMVVIYAPVIYFHTRQDVSIHVKVEFPGGRPAVWWPGNSNIDYHPGQLGAKVDPATCDKHLEWLLDLKTAPPDLPGLVSLPKDHWLGACRNVKATDVITRSRGIRSQEREKFVYYDGIIPSPKAAELLVAPERISLKNRAKHALLDVTVVDRRTPGKILVARAAHVEAGAEVRTLEFEECLLERWPAMPVAALVGQLIGVGLNEDEAQALAAVWKKEFFEADGLTLFYRLPQAEFDRMLPLTVKPQPEKVIRTLLVHHPHCEPDLGERVMALVKQLDSNSFQERLDAHKRIQALGRAAFVHLLRARNAKPSLEVKARLNKLLDEFESERAFSHP